MTISLARKKAEQTAYHLRERGRSGDGGGSEGETDAETNWSNIPTSI